MDDFENGISVSRTQVINDCSSSIKRSYSKNKLYEYVSNFKEGVSLSKNMETG